MYFMGFVWTLWALIDSFVLRTIGAGDAIFRVFGYALVTTAAGMFCRLAILQFKYTATEQSDEAQVSVEEALLKFGATLQATQQVMVDWHSMLSGAVITIRSGNTALIGTLEAVRHEITSTTTAATKAYGTMLETMESQLDAAIKKIGSDLNTTLHSSLASGLKDFGTQSAANLDQVREATVGLATTLKRTNTGLGKSITELTDTVNGATQGLGNTATMVAGSAERITAALDAVTTKLEVGISSLSDGMQEAGKSVISSTESMSREMSGLAEVIRREITLGLDNIEVTPQAKITIDPAVLDSAVAPLRASLNDVEARAAEIQKALARTTATTPPSEELWRHVDKTVNTAVATITGRLEHIRADVQDLRGQVSTQRSGWWPWAGRK
jgi:hypothetical protein